MDYYKIQKINYYVENLNYIIVKVRDIEIEECKFHSDKNLDFFRRCTF